VRLSNGLGGVEGRGGVAQTPGEDPSLNAAESHPRDFNRVDNVHSFVSRRSVNASRNWFFGFYGVVFLISLRVYSHI